MTLTDTVAVRDSLLVLSDVTVSLAVPEDCCPDKVRDADVEDVLCSEAVRDEEFVADNDSVADHTGAVGVRVPLSVKDAAAVSDT